MSSYTISQTFNTLWSNEISIAFQRQGSLLQPATQKITLQKGQTYKPHILAATTYTTKERGGNLIAQNADHSVGTLTFSDAYSCHLVDDLDLLKTNVDVRRSYTKNIINALGKSFDDNILTALSSAATAANTTNSNSAAVVSIDLLSEAVSIAKSNYAFSANDMTFILTPGVERKINGITGFTSSDFISKDQPLNSGSRTTLMGANVIILPDSGLVNSTTHTCYLVNNTATQLVVNKDISVSTDWLPEKFSYQVAGSCSSGAVVVQPAGVIRLLVTVS